MEQALVQVGKIFLDDLQEQKRPVKTVLSVAPPPQMDGRKFFKFNPIQELTSGEQNYLRAMNAYDDTIFERVFPTSDKAKDIAMDSIDTKKMKKIMNKEFLDENLEYFDKVIEAATVIWGRIVKSFSESRNSELVELGTYLAQKLLTNSNNVHVNNSHVSNVRKSLERPFTKPLYFTKMLELKNVLAGKSQAIENLWKQFDPDEKHFKKFGKPIIKWFTGGSLIVHFQITISTKDLDLFDKP